MRAADLRQAWLGHANLREACLVRADLRGAKLLDANMEWARLPHAQLGKAYLAGANLRGANLRHANLRGADLWCARLWRANLSEACLEEANLVQADLRGADLRQTGLSGAFLDGVKWGATQLSRQCFGQEIGEESVGDYAKARAVYHALRDMFESLGQHEDARWAHQKEHRMARRTYRLHYLTQTLHRTWEFDTLSTVWHHLHVWTQWVQRVGLEVPTWSLDPGRPPLPLRRAAGPTAIIMMLFAMLLVLG